MRVGIIDADLIARKKHRFPNVACMKISGFHKAQGDQVELLTSFQVLGWDKIYLSKVFTDTEVPGELLSAPNVVYGGTGFYFDKAPDLPYEIEHSFPDYHLYDKWVQSKLAAGGKPKDYVYYTDYSIGFLTRGCFRKCEFCVNKKYDRCVPHSPLSEFLDPERKKICFLDDNFFACPKWETLIQDVIATGKRFQFKQGLDERLLTDKKIHSLMSWKYDGDVTFAFDDIEDKPLIEKKMMRFRELYPDTKKHLRFFVLCGFDKNGVYDDAFWERDIVSVFERIRTLRKYRAIPYIMRFEKVYSSRFSGFYSSVCAWVNQPVLFKKFSFNNFYESTNDARKRHIDAFIQEYPQIAQQYFDERMC